MRRQIRAGNGFVAAMEAEEEIAAVAASDKVGDNAESLETDLLEVDDSEAEVEDNEKKTEEAVDVMNALESIIIALESSIEHGGISKDGAATLAVATDYMYAKVGFSKKSIPALEAFGNDVTREKATSIAIEGFVDSVKKIWEAIVAAMKKAFEWVADFFINIFRGADHLKARAEKLKKAAKQNEGGIKEKTIENEHLAGALQISGEVITNIHANLKIFHGLVESTFNTSKNQSKTFASSFAVMFEKELLNVEHVAKFLVYKGDYTSDEVVHNPEQAGFIAVPENLVFVRSAEMFGGKAIVGVLADKNLNGKALYDVIDNISIRVGDFNPKATKGTLKSLPTMNANDAGYVADQVITIADQLLKYKALNKELNKIKRDFNLRLLKINLLIPEFAEHGRQASPHYTNKEINHVVQSCKQAARFFVRMIEQPATSMASYTLRTGKALLDYVEESLKRLDDSVGGSHSSPTSTMLLGMNKKPEPKQSKEKPEYTSFTETEIPLKNSKNNFKEA